MQDDPHHYWETHNQWFQELYTKANWFDRLLRKDVYFRMAVAHELCSQHPGARVLDIGCGSGHVDLALLTKAGASHVTGIDFSSSMLQVARQLLAEQGLDRKAQFIEANIMEYDFGQNDFDLVLALGVFDYVGTPRQLWQKMTACAKYAVVASFPKPQFPRSLLRRARFRLRGCPVYFYSAHDLEDLTACAPEFSVTRLAGQSGFVLVAKRIVHHATRQNELSPAGGATGVTSSGS